VGNICLPEESCLQEIYLIHEPHDAPLFGRTSVDDIASVSWQNIFGPKRGGVTGGWRKLHNEELHNLYSSPSIIRIIKSRRMRWVGHVARMGEKRNVYRLLVGKPEGK
jgi:hypothetical protein